MEGNDLYEGVRELLVNKTKNPRWEPSSIPLVKAEVVDRYFNFPANLIVPLPRL